MIYLIHLSEIGRAQADKYANMKQFYVQADSIDEAVHMALNEAGNTYELDCVSVVNRLHFLGF